MRATGLTNSLYVKFSSKSIKSLYKFSQSLLLTSLTLFIWIIPKVFLFLHAPVVKPLSSIQSVAALMTWTVHHSSAVCWIESRVRVHKKWRKRQASSNNFPHLEEPAETSDFEFAGGEQLDISGVAGSSSRWISPWWRCEEPEFGYDARNNWDVEGA